MVKHRSFRWYENRRNRHIERGTDERLFKADIIAQ